MIAQDDPVGFKLRAHQMDLIMAMAELACVGGTSRVRKDRGDRMASILEDQVIGQIGQYVGSLWLTGSEEKYKTQRWFANRNPMAGDGGSDIPGSNMDFKTSLMRRSQDPLCYNLLVRPDELHKDWVYFLVLVEKDWSEDEAVTWLVGWATTTMLPEYPAASGVFEGAHVLKADRLNPVPPIRYRWMST